VLVLVRSHGYSYAEITYLVAVRWVPLIGELLIVYRWSVGTVVRW